MREWAGPESLGSSSSFRVEYSKFNPAVGNGTKLCNMKPVNHLPPSYLPQDGLPSLG